MRNKDVGQLTRLLKGQTILYGELLRLAEKLSQLLSAKKETDELFPVISERNELFVKIKAGDGAISALLAQPGIKKLLEENEPKSLIEELKSLIKKVMETDSACEDKIISDKNVVQEEFSKLMKTKKGMGVYGSSRKPVYAKFIDLKH